MLFFWFISLLCPCFIFAADETITLTTYYPSPYGSYNELNTYGNTYLSINTGNVGIGTTTPTAKLQVNTTSTTGTGRAMIGFTTPGWWGNQGVSNYFGGWATSTAPLFKVESYHGSDPRDKLLQVARMGDIPYLTVQGGGNVGIGTVDPGAKFNIVGGGIDIGQQGLPYQTCANGTTKGAGPEMTFWAPCEGYIGTNFMHNGGRIYTKMPYADWNWTELVLQAGNDWNRFVDNQLVLRGNGNVGIRNADPGYTLTVSGTAWCSSGAWSGSDRRWKKNISALDDPLRKLLRLSGVGYEWRREEFKDKNFPAGRQIGIIAQEMEKEFPELVDTDKNGYKSIAYDRFTAVLLEAVKAQQEQIISQSQKINDMDAKFKSEVNKLMDRLELLEGNAKK